ncbi:MAG: glycoside hydrolase family 16 protein [Clostridiales bacterium]|nr:glycoside hydrolase family 16 protein [Clostridiales bacterium]
MLEQIADLIHLSRRQTRSLSEIGDIIKELMSGGVPLKKALSCLLIMAELFGVVFFNTAVTPHGQTLDLTGYDLVFCEEFEGDSLNTDLWFSRNNGERRGGFNAASQIKVKDGKLVITGEYLEDGTYGEGWYGAAISLHKKYKQGYFEIKCICNDSPDFWSAFWIQADHPYEHDISKGGIGGAELDIFESDNYEEKLPSYHNSVTQTIHCNGVDDDVENIDSYRLGSFKGKDIYHTYNTYGLEWTEDEYIFYVNGVETTRTSFGNGVSQEEEWVIVSLELPEEINLSKDTKTEFIVDYVKIWQK